MYTLNTFAQILTAIQTASIKSVTCVIDTMTAWRLTFLSIGLNTFLNEIFWAFFKSAISRMKMTYYQDTYTLRIIWGAFNGVSKNKASIIYLFANNFYESQATCVRGH